LSEPTQAIHLPDFIVEWVDVGVFVVNRNMEVTLWNRFMSNHSGLDADAVVGRNLFDCFPDLPKAWLSKKVQGVFLLRNFAFTSWEQRPYLFRFPHNRPITGGVDHMYQNCTFMPVKGASGEVDSVCVTLFDATDVGISQTELKKAMARLAESSNRDGLTGIYNRRYLEQRLSAEFDRCRRYRDHFSFVLFDLDHFKRINDTYGHLAGDEVLCVVSRRIDELLRSVDVMARYGGEEFGVILPATAMQSARILAERIRLVIEREPVEYKGIPIPVTASIGIAEFEAAAPSHEHLIRCADVALYHAKASGRNRVACYAPELEAAAPPA
jgi:diguanylate cyclase (GGDEF)-like protein